MPKVTYEAHNFRKQASLIIATADDIINEYQANGYDLTLRQLYYQFVSRDIIQNTQKEYDKLGTIISNARLSGLIDWDAIVDRTRDTHKNSHFDGPGDILSIAAKHYKIDSRRDQEFHVEVWVEKEALLGVIEPICRRLDVTYLACRGYFSQSAMYAASQRMRAAEHNGKKTVVLHFGDHDPSGLDMTRDIQVRLQNFYTNTKVRRIALNMNQVQQYKPPPNFAKLTDTRANIYIAEYGSKSWELDALDPKVITELIDDAVGEYTDEYKRQALLDEQEADRRKLNYVVEHWEEMGI